MSGFASDICCAVFTLSAESEYVRGPRAMTTASADLNAGNVFKPPYTYKLDATTGLHASLTSMVGPN
jgi:hypothetical protein